MFSFPSTKYRTPEEDLMLEIALETEKLSIAWFIFDFFLKPAVSKSSILSFLKTIDLEIASLVVPALGETIERFSLIKELKKVDFPALGFPRILTLILWLTISCSRPELVYMGNRFKTSSLRFFIPKPFLADTLIKLLTPSW